MLANTLGLGGTEKGLASFALELDRSAFDVAVVAVHDDGPRRAQLEAAGIPVAVAGGDEARLAELLEGADVAHVFRAGNAEPLVPAAAARAGVGHLVEANIFGNVDRSPDEERFAAHLFMSRMCLLRYRERIGAGWDGFHARHRVLSFPIEHEELRSRAPAKAAARERLGLDPDRPVVGRVGRADDMKWRDLVVDMIPPLLELVGEAQVLLVGATPAKVARLRRLGVLERCVLHEPTLDPETLSAFYAACDVFVTAAEIGESQGMAIAEALALEIPVVTCSTPWADNAQVEFVEHGVCGWLAGHPQPFAEAVADLLRDEDRRRAFGAAGRAAVERDLSAGPLTRQLERLYRGLLDGSEALESWSPSPAEVERFAAEYPERAAAEYRPLTARERLEARAVRARERAGHLRGAAAGMLAARRPRLAVVAGGERSGEFRAPAGGGYYAAARPELVAQLPRPLGRVLDIGCGAGGVGRTLRAAGAAEIVGVEPHAPSAEIARGVLDAVHTGPAEEVLASGAAGAGFDTICLYDVLEHTVDPLAVLREIPPLVAAGGRLHVSVPNARHFSLVYDLVARGTFGYTEWGHRDSTHLRWFTRRDLVALLEREGWRVESVRPAIYGRGRLADRLTLGLAREFLALQWQVLARR